MDFIEDNACRVINVVKSYNCRNDSQRNDQEIIAKWKVFGSVNNRRRVVHFGLFPTNGHLNCETKNGVEGTYV